MNKKIMLLISAIIGIMLIFPLVNAAATIESTMTTPVFFGNYSGTITVSVTGAVNITNATCHYNATGGAATSVTGNITTAAGLVNTTDVSADGTTFSTTWATSTLSDRSKNVNISCLLYNGTLELNSTVSAGNITIDNTVPTNGISIDTESISSRDNVLVTWSFTDATSGLRLYSVTITPPDTTECSIITESGTSGTDGLWDSETACAGTYTVNATVTDYAGNENNISKTFKVTLAGLSKSGSNTLSGTGTASLGQYKEWFSGLDSNTKIALIIIIGVAGYYLLKKRK